MPVRDGGQYLSAAVDSILQQRDVKLELIIVDDHSSDGAIEHLAPDPSLRILPAPSPGIVAALNAGIAAAKYPLIARMDGDDIATPDRLKTQRDYLLANPDVDICGTRVRMFCDDGDVAGGYQLYEKWINGLCRHEEIERAFFIESPIPHPSVMMQRDRILDLGGYHDCAWPEDYDLWCRALLANMRFGKPDSSPLLDWRDQGERLSRTDSRYSKQRFLQCKAYYLSQYLKAQGIKRCTIWGTGPTGLKLHDYLADEGMIINGFIDVNQKMRDRSKRGKPVLVTSEQASNAELGEFKNIPDSIIIVAVSARGARQQIADYLQDCGLLEQQDFILAA